MQYTSLVFGLSSNDTATHLRMAGAEHERGCVPTYGREPAGDSKWFPLSSLPDPQVQASRGKSRVSSHRDTPDTLVRGGHHADTGLSQYLGYARAGSLSVAKEIASRIALEELVRVPQAASCKCTPSPKGKVRASRTGSGTA